MKLRMCSFVAALVLLPLAASASAVVIVSEPEVFALLGLGGVAAAAIVALRKRTK